VGCGVGAQTLALARRSPDAQLIAIDIAEASIAAARRRIDEAGLHNVEFRLADVGALPFPPSSFDHIFVCFVLEHLPDPADVLGQLRELLTPGGTLTAIEGDHGSPLFHPESAAARRVIDCQVELQRRAGGDACIGRRLHPLLTQARFVDVNVAPRMAYADASRPDWVEGFTRQTFTAMVAGVRDEAIEAGLADAASFDRGVRALERTAAPDGTFCYTFFKASGRRPR
jgi:SAM-dependent methyltransferase